MSETIKIMLDENAYKITKAHSSDAGWDLYAKEDFDVPPYSFHYNNYDAVEIDEGFAIHDTGVHIAIPEGYVGFIKSKSGLNIKHGLTAEGVIDAGYTGPIIVKLYNHTSKPYHFNAGDKITQLVILPINMNTVELVDSLDETDRGNGGFGSSGK